MKTLIRLYRSAAAVLLAAVGLHAEVREAVAYLEREVPKWKRENKCYSCHNNGDGLRALLVARRAGLAVDPKALSEALPALQPPEEWEAKPLARLQMAVATREAVAAGLLDAAVLARAAAAVAADQQPDGHWKVEEELSAGSPVTWGPALATHLAREVLSSAAASGYTGPIAKATQWLEQYKPRYILDTAALALALGRKRDLDSLAAAQAMDGSWGGEAFDTAVARLALGASHPALAAKAREWLLKSQWSGGGWPATTRPGGGDSYAQHISTTAWVLQSLIGKPKRTIETEPVE